MGGFVLVSPDYPPFPINAEQLYYLVANCHVDFPSITKAEIKTLSKTDSLSKLIILWQVFWFSTSELQRARLGLPMTTFELTALSYSLTMMMTSICWYAKPTIASPIMLYTKGGKSVDEIRAMARETTHPRLSKAWYRSPLDFISPYRRFRPEVHWAYYEQLTYMVGLPVFSRKVTARPWDRLPSESFLVIDKTLLIPALVIMTGFSISPLIAWNFHFPTTQERLVWRVCSVYHAVFSITLGIYYVVAAMKAHSKADNVTTWPQSPKPSEVERCEAAGKDTTTTTQAGTIGYDMEAAEVTASQTQEYVGFIVIRVAKIKAWLKSWHNISPDGDPEMGIGLPASISVLVGSFLYISCRAFFYVEDCVSIRQQPAGVYVAMNKFVPFMN
ncbi:hypothetical protein B0J18DRAFT_261929 [Chaetomium sp. MPI-SDFR-AT-0129]|nr:hypothetical protein B0J18DRAFT_261929 [Chaetomium sp. MPI-SDFR-AT-0129]